MTAVLAPRKSLEPILKDEVEFYDHQIEGVRRLARLKSFLLADDMGLGKSLQALTVFAIDAKLGKAETCIIVCPVTLRANWADEIEKFTRLPYTLFGEVEERVGHRERLRKLTPAWREEQLHQFIHGHGPRVLIANYEQLASPKHAATLKGFTFDVAIFDEAHYIKNPNAARSKASLELKSGRNFMLTGTPILNQVDELWSILHKIDPVKWPKYWTFKNRYCVFGGYKDKQIIGTKNQTELVAALGEVMLRRVKKDVLTLPEPYITQVKVGLSDLQRQLYDSVEEDLRLGESDIDNALTKFLRLKQICGTPACLDDGSYADDSLKLDRAVEIILEQNASGEKVVVFTQFRGVLKALAERLHKSGSNAPIYQLHGDIPTDSRVGEVKLWGAERGPSNLLCMTQVAGIGLNMTKASVCVFIDKLFVPGLNRQAIDRLYRIGQDETKPVQVFELIARGTIESRVEQILRSKSKLFGEIVEGGVGMRALLEALMNEEEE